MRLFECQHCRQPLFFENDKCDSCGRHLGYIPELGTMSAVEPDGDRWKALADTTNLYRFCANTAFDACNWLVLADSPETFCAACRHNRMIPDLSVPQNVARWRKIETAKHRLFYTLVRLYLPRPTRTEEPESGLAFDFLQAAAPSKPVMTGHASGLITLSLSEADDSERERQRNAMEEPYRTLLGHFRHEIGHYYFYRLVEPSPSYATRFRELYGDPDADYQAALDRHYNEGAPPGWEDNYVSTYATMHPAEDWAETFAHYLHIRDTLDTAAAFGFAPAAATFERRALGPSGFDAIIDMWLPLAWALNMINRSMGREDLYPFVLPPMVLDKMRFTHTIIDEITSDPAKLAEISSP